MRERFKKAVAQFKEIAISYLRRPAELRMNAIKSRFEAGCQVDVGLSEDARDGLTSWMIETFPRESFAQVDQYKLPHYEEYIEIRVDNLIRNTHIVRIRDGQWEIKTAYLPVSEELYAPIDPMHINRFSIIWNPKDYKTQ